MRLLTMLTTAGAMVVGLWAVIEAADIHLSLVPSLIVAMLLTTALHLALNRPNWRS